MQIIVLIGYSERVEARRINILKPPKLTQLDGRKGKTLEAQVVKTARRLFKKK